MEGEITMVTAKPTCQEEESSADLFRALNPWMVGGVKIHREIITPRSEPPRYPKPDENHRKSEPQTPAQTVPPQPKTSKISQIAQHPAITEKPDNNPKSQTNNKSRKIKNLPREVWSGNHVVMLEGRMYSVDSIAYRLFAKTDKIPRIS